MLLRGRSKISVWLQSMPLFSLESAVKWMSNTIFPLPARSVLLVRAYTVLEKDLAVWILLDVITTIAILIMGGVELNPGAAYIMSIHPALWIVCMAGALLFYVCSARALNKHLRIQIGLGLLVLIFPILLECYAVVNNVGVLGTML
jgi:hypothetical protein